MKKRNLKWYEIIGTGTLLYFIGLFIGGMAGNVVTIFGGHLLLLVGIVSAGIQGVSGENKDATPLNRIGGVCLAILIVFIVLVIDVLIST